MNRNVIIFDLDGTLLNTLDDLAASTNYACISCGFPPRSTEEVRQFVGNGVRRLMELAIPDGTQNPRFEQCFTLFKEHYLIHCQDKTAPYPGVMELLDKLTNAGISMAIVSNKYDPAVKALVKHYFPGITVAVGENEPLGIRRKPAPDMVLSALEQLGAGQADAVFCGDSDVDIATAKASGLPCISVLWGFRDKAFLDAAGAARFVSFPWEIPALLAEI